MQSISWSDFEKELPELRTERDAVELLDEAQFDSTWRPAFSSPRQYWRDVLHALQAGREENALDRLTRAFGRLYPGNRLVARRRPDGTVDFSGVGWDALEPVLRDAYDEDERAEVFLNAIDFPGERPEFSDPDTFWREIRRRAENGATNGVAPFLERFRAEYPYHRIFSGTPQQPPAVPPGEFDIRVLGEFNAANVLEVARQVLAERGGGAEVRPGVIARGAMVLTLTGLRSDQAVQVPEELERRLRRSSGSLSVEMASPQFREYLFRRLYAEGPDGRRFELSDVPASTTGQDVARTVLDQYPDAVTRDAKGKPRPTVVDKVNTDGSPERIPPAATLHETGVRDGQTLTVHPESTAGMVDPAVRDSALVRVKNQLIEFARRHPDFAVYANSDDWPTDYEIEFTAPSFAPPQVEGGPPLPIERHRVRIFLSPEYPIGPPLVLWLTPIFHPNVSGNEPRKACLGMLEERYRPGLDFGDLCQMLIDMAAYENYVVEEGYNLDAQRWATSPAGMVLIEQRGGRSLLRKYFDASRPPRVLHIRPLD